MVYYVNANCIYRLFLLMQYFLMPFLAPILHTSGEDSKYLSHKPILKILYHVQEMPI